MALAAVTGPVSRTLQYLGLVDPVEEPYTEYTYADTKRATVTKLDTRRRNRHQDYQETANEIVTLHPKVYSDVKLIAENFREGIPVIMNLSQMEISEARRIIDFASGLAQGLYGTIERVTSKVFLLSPEHLIVSGDQAAETAEVDTTFFRSN